MAPSRNPIPLPRVVLSRVSSDEGAGGGSFLSRAPAWGCTVLRLGPIGHLEGLRIVAAHRDLAPLIPWTCPLNGNTLADALSRFSEIVIQPDLPSQGAGLYRLRRHRRGWLLASLPPGRGQQRLLPSRAAVHAALGQLLPAGRPYVVQEAAALASFLGHPFDLLALVQKDGHGRWEASALAARILSTEPETGPTPYGWTASAEVALRHAFPERWKDLWERACRIAAAAARAVDRTRGPLFELGVRMAVSPDGSVHLLQVEGEPQAEHLSLLHDPYAARRVYGCPIACAAALDGEKRHVPRSPVVARA